MFLSPRFVWLRFLQDSCSTWLFFYFVGPLWFVLSGRSIRFVGPQFTPNPLPRSHPFLPLSASSLCFRPRAPTASVAIWCTAVPVKVQRFVLVYVLQSVASQSHPAYPWCHAAPHFFISFFSYFVILFDFDLCRALLLLFSVASGVGQRTPTARSLVAKNGARCLKRTRMN